MTDKLNSFVFDDNKFFFLLLGVALSPTATRREC